MVTSFDAFITGRRSACVSDPGWVKVRLLQLSFGVQRG